MNRPIKWPIKDCSENLSSTNVCVIGRTHEAPPIHRKWLSHKFLGTAAGLSILPLRGKVSQTKKRALEGTPSRSLTNIQSRRDFAFVRSSRLIRDILPTRLTSSFLRLFLFSFFIVSCRTSRPQPMKLSSRGKIIRKLARPKILEGIARAVSGGEKFPVSSESKG